MNKGLSIHQKYWINWIGSNPISLLDLPLSLLQKSFAHHEFQTELQLDNEIFVFLKEKKRKRNAAEEKENNLPQTKMKPSEVISLPTIVNNILPNLTYLNLRNKSNSCTESTELRFPDEIVNWAGFEQGVLALQPEVDTVPKTNI
ncbi:hypothetical protein GLOIN_2v1480900 [Rhizophagus irregularis DAOM 181602=DAOM 197198]|uniref:Uncharacterized protein n=1 Tax=Rhizophagus irregularis (strain DAOM 181602 / DAOM 197198 / MUCL 43194) TaxID=747089 RepID=A0A2P4PSC6_RHIID|nr:hypothetical protein GLOIN_2v1480900 [Rhizophagus irregularis DAOM 181602=DAOM 197198]POG68289.1 hypothetical protein GLOIN_2v1480900 [Rhizophagus irregularis DAOM 181602=DAOM 197198]|eukprot:XP_025175155.1 hypothetical protein GLOIN_2v1480900 [Rhizophagus irregularis DAOM 181602=DAOM 197198]